MNDAFRTEGYHMEEYLLSMGLDERLGDTWYGTRIRAMITPCSNRHLNAIDLGRDRTLNLAHRRPARYTDCVTQADYYLSSEWDEDDNAGEMSPEFNTESYPAFAHIGLRKTPKKNLNQVTYPDRYIVLPAATSDHIPRGPSLVTVRSRFYIGASPKYRKKTEMVMMMMMMMMIVVVMVMMLKEGKCNYDGETSPRSSVESYSAILFHLVEGILGKTQPDNQNSSLQHVSGNASFPSYGLHNIEIHRNVFLSAISMYGRMKTHVQLFHLITRTLNTAQYRRIFMEFVGQLDSIELRQDEMLTRFNDFNNIIFSDEAHFHPDGYVNKHNCRYWSTENPQEKHQRPLHSPKVTVWATLSSQGIIGLFFFEDGRGRTRTVNADRYSRMIESFLGPTLQNFVGFNDET
ncbi:hypothetical protein ANN_14688 [Periplaneta americana]|uniref:PiggyBac transposable element-derived protein domain-containing protein n=1 Tax=Periplaneta americana TaxID=6978 RepID=A0ABQ8SYK5_PERAM|nr:hypothetical protein ANN_14688 [Periplaneta americana]